MRKFLKFNNPINFPESVNNCKNFINKNYNLHGPGENISNIKKLLKSRFGFENCLLTNSCTSALEIAALTLMQYSPNKKNEIIEKIISLKKTMKRNKKIIESNPIVYKTKIDTTFALYNKKYIKKNKLDALSLGGEFTCKHLPWEKNYKLPKKENAEYINSKLKDISATINQ